MSFLIIVTFCLVRYTHLLIEFHKYLVYFCDTHPSPLPSCLHTTPSFPYFPCIHMSPNGNQRKLVKQWLYKTTLYSGYAWSVQSSIGKCDCNTQPTTSIAATKYFHEHVCTAFVNIQLLTYMYMYSLYTN